MAGRASLALGVDAAGRRGWVGVVVGAGGFVSATVHPTLGGLIAEVDATVDGVVRSVGVDIPIGLVAAGQRVADREARAFVGSRRNSVFWAPHRDALGFASQAEANVHLESIGMPKASAQAMALVPRIREAADVAAGDRRVVEVFPEASFRLLAGDELRTSKKTASGSLHRLALLAAADPPIALPADLGAAGAVGLDDLFDAGAAAWSAWRVAHGRAVPLGDPDERDPVTGHRVAVWV